MPKIGEPLKTKRGSGLFRFIERTAEGKLYLPPNIENALKTIVRRDYCLAFTQKRLVRFIELPNIENALKTIVHRDYCLAFTKKTAREIYRAA